MATPESRPVSTLPVACASTRLLTGTHRVLPYPFLGGLMSRIKHLVPHTLKDGYGRTMHLHPKLSEKIAQFKYNDGDRFNRHVDGLFPGQGINAAGDGIEEWPGVVSGMSILLYLNDGPHDGLGRRNPTLVGHGRSI